MKQYWFKNENYGDDWQAFEGKRAFDSEDVASQVAENYYNDDPTDANDFDFKVSVRNEAGEVSTFRVTAYYNVDFYAREIDFNAKGGNPNG